MKTYQTKFILVSEQGKKEELTVAKKQDNQIMYMCW